MVREKLTATSAASSPRASQKDGIDYMETFATVAKFDSIQTLLAFADASGITVY